MIVGQVTYQNMIGENAIVNSSGTTWPWASETQRLRHTILFAFEIKPRSVVTAQHTSDFFTALCRVREVFYYYEVKFRDAELARIFNSGYRARIHRSGGDSGQNKGNELTRGADSIVDGGTIVWEKFKRFKGMTT